MKIDEALKLGDVAVTSTGSCVYQAKGTDWYYRGGKTYSLHELKDHEPLGTWQPAYIRPQFQIGEKVPFLQACLSGQCFVAGNSKNARRCIDIKLGKMKVYNADGHWVDTTKDFCPSDICTIVADPSQKQPETEKRQRTHAEIVADIKTLVSELEGVK